MSESGTVREWWEDDGWGVIDSAAAPGGCWVHVSSVLVAGHRTLTPGQEVSFDLEAADQDGYRYRALAVWPAGQEPQSTTIVVTGPTDAYRSELTLTFDDDGPDAARGP